MADSKPKIPGLRRFMVFTQPHSMDPAWAHPVVELDDSTEPATSIEYDDIVILEQVILQLGRDRARSAGYNAGAKNVLDTFGLTPADYLARKKANKVAKNSVDTPPQTGVGSTDGK